MDQPAIDEEEAEPRFLVIAGNDPMEVEAFTAVLAVLHPAAVIIDNSHEGRSLAELARRQGVAVLVQDHFDDTTGIDGVHLTEPSRVAEARSFLDRHRQDNPILGADIGHSRHDAMVAGEAGADYVAFGSRKTSADNGVIDLVAWWRSTTVLPCLAYAGNVDAAGRLVKAGTDLVGVGDLLWNHPDGPLFAAEALTAVL